MSQHADLTPERWQTFTLEQQILMIANEMNRASKLLATAHTEARCRAYERVLALVDLTIGAAAKRTLRRELLRWRDLITFLYIEPEAVPARHADAFRSLLLLTPASSLQLAHVTMPKP